VRAMRVWRGYPVSGALCHYDKVRTYEMTKTFMNIFSRRVADDE
jgi:hypothetical protein